MSDPVTNVEIEDVLSSIRRLVTVDSARNRRAPVSDSVASLRPAPRKLVLTEDLRIVEPAAPHESAAKAPDVADNYTRTLERRIAELEAAVTAQAAEFEDDGSEDTSRHRPTAVLFPASAAPVEAVEQDGALQLDRLVRQDAPKPQDTEESPGPEAGDAAAFIHTGETFELEEDGDAPEAPHDAIVQEETPVEHAAMWSESGLHGEDDGIEIFDAESHRKSARDDATAEFVFSNEDTVIDEETLRDMVAEIVRDELQGALGERITRNVRKLVRREIMRAISIRDFE